MKKNIILILSVNIILIVLPIATAAHFIVGYVNNALDGTSANEHTAILWNPSIGLSDNLTDIIGINGNSKTNNVYLIDCEMLATPCEVGDEIKVQVINNGDSYISNYVNLTVTGAGFDIAPNMTLNSPPRINDVAVDDSFSFPALEIDLIPASTREVNCYGTVYEFEGEESLTNVTAEFFDASLSFFGDSDDNNKHYTNNSCSLNFSYGGENEVYFNCTFQIEYYANAGNWNCTAQAADNLSVSGKGSNATNINTLLALSIPSPLDFGVINSSEVGSEKQVNVTNVGNVMVNLSLSGYGNVEGDGLAMNCSLGAVKNISIQYEKFNLTESNSEDLTLTEFESLYLNLTSSPAVRKFNLPHRQNDISQFIDDTNATYWRVYVPAGVSGSCQGNVVFGAVQSEES